MNRYDKFVNSTAFWSQSWSYLAQKVLGVCFFFTVAIHFLSLCSSIHWSATFTHSITMLRHFFVPRFGGQSSCFCLTRFSFSFYPLARFCLSVCLSIYLLIYLSIYLSTYLSIWGATSLICGDFSVALMRGRLHFAFNFELGRWNFVCQKYFSSHYVDSKYLYDALKVNLQVHDK